jgi:hypothetical protein
MSTALIVGIAIIVVIVVGAAVALAIRAAQQRRQTRVEGGSVDLRWNRGPIAFAHPVWPSTEGTQCRRPRS